MENPITKKGNIATISEISTMIESQAIPLISIGGIPGAGKSYNAALLNKSLQNSIVVPMDGFHLYRRELSAEGIKYRGVVFTFDLEKFAKKMRQLQEGIRPIYFPSFDHALKDPVEDSICVDASIKHIIVQGLYVFLPEIALGQKWLKLWVETDIDRAMHLVAKRHLQCGIQDSLQKCVSRAEENDRVNAQYVLHHSNLINTYIISNVFSLQ